MVIPPLVSSEARPVRHSGRRISEGQSEALVDSVVHRTGHLRLRRKFWFSVFVRVDISGDSRIGHHFLRRALTMTTKKIKTTSTGQTGANRIELSRTPTE